MDKIVCLGKNYPEHIKELGDKSPSLPVLFLKPPSVLKCALRIGERVFAKFPKDSGSVHHECEIVFKVGKNDIEAVTLGLDMTLRNRQSELKKNGHPWTISKVFSDSAIVGPWVALAEFPDFKQTEFSFEVAGTIRQKGRASQMILPIEKMVAFAGQFFPVLPGDLFFTGTPAGVGEISIGAVAKLSWGKIVYAVEWV